MMFDLERGRGGDPIARTKAGKVVILHPAPGAGTPKIGEVWEGEITREDDRVCHARLTHKAAATCRWNPERGGVEYTTPHGTQGFMGYPGDHLGYGIDPAPMRAEWARAQAEAATLPVTWEAWSLSCQSYPTHQILRTRKGRAANGYRVEESEVLPVALPPYGEPVPDEALRTLAGLGIEFTAPEREGVCHANLPGQVDRVALHITRGRPVSASLEGEGTVVTQHTAGPEEWGWAIPRRVHAQYAPADEVETILSLLTPEEQFRFLQARDAGETAGLRQGTRYRASVHESRIRRLQDLCARIEAVAAASEAEERIDISTAEHRGMEYESPDGWGTRWDTYWMTTVQTCTLRFTLAGRFDTVRDVLTALTEEEVL